MRAREDPLQGSMYHVGWKGKRGGKLQEREEGEKMLGKEGR